MIAVLLGLWRYGLLAALLAAAGVWHLAEKSKAVDDAVELVRAEYITAAMAASESARSKERTLNLSIESLRHDFQLQKTRNAANAVASAGRLRDLQAALDGASAVSADTPSASGIVSPFAAIASECSRTLAQMDGYVAELASTARALQHYAASVHLGQ